MDVGDAAGRLGYALGEATGWAIGMDVGDAAAAGLGFGFDKFDSEFAAAIVAVQPVAYTTVASRRRPNESALILPCCLI
jgi:hypothetical protein